MALPVFFPLSFSFFIHVARANASKRIKKFVSGEVRIRDIWRQSRVYDRSRRRTAIASICRGCWKNRPIVPRPRLTGRGKELIRWTMAEIENKISPPPLEKQRNHPRKKIYRIVPEIRYLLYLSFPFFFSFSSSSKSKKKKAVDVCKNAGCRFFHRNCAPLNERIFRTNFRTHAGNASLR